MSLSKNDLDQEKQYLKTCLKEINTQIDILGEDLQVEKNDIKDFRKFIWENKGSMDPIEVRSTSLMAEQEYYTFERRAKYLKKLYRVKNSPYFGRIDFKEDQAFKSNTIYIGITHLTKNNNNMIYDWRSPISSIFYDYELGNVSYIAPEGTITGLLTKKRQYKIKESKLVNIFDNDVNVTDEFLQEILTNASSDKMKNIVNTIQREQNEIIRDTRSPNLIVQGIAGSGKTSVALHRIAFLLYKINNLRSNNVLIFAPNDIFSEYISNVLPELGEDNVTESTFSDFAIRYVAGYRCIENFTSFIERYYTKMNSNTDLIRCKMADEMIDVIQKYVDDLVNNASFVNDVTIDILDHDKEYLNNLFHNRYSKVTLFERIDLIAEHICNKEGKNYNKLGKTIKNKLWQNFNVSKDIRTLFKNLFKSKYFKDYYQSELSDREITTFVNSKNLAYEDSLILIYLQGLLQSFPYSSLIKQIIIDEAQDYSKLQYIILKKTFPNASYTILGDISQNINPYYNYESLQDLSSILGNTKYLELNKTYRSSPEIIDYANKIMNLNHVVSVRHSNDFPVIKETSTNIHEQLKKDISDGIKVHSKIAIITKTHEEASHLYEQLKNDFPNINYLTEKNKVISYDLVIIPSYLSKGLEFDYVIVYTDKDNAYRENEKHLYYVVVTRAQHQLKIYNQN